MSNTSPDSPQENLNSSEHLSKNVNMSDDTDQVHRITDSDFDADVAKLISFGEDLRISLMQKHRTRSNIATASFILFVLAGATGFGWFLFMEGRIDLAIMCVVLSTAIPFAANAWAATPLKTYKTQYKTQFMPRLAKILGGFKFFPNRGIGKQFLSKTGVLPRFETYNAEDCFMGIYKGIKVIFSEAKLYNASSKSTPVFDGIFVLLESKSDIFDSHTILTTDHKMVREYAGKRWQKLQSVKLDTSSHGDISFSAYSSKPDSAQGMIDAPLLKELAEASLIFNKAPITAITFAKRFVFIMIPYAPDMFEASDVNIPIKTKQHALTCKQEINQILEIIDVFGSFNDIRQQNLEA